MGTRRSGVVQFANNNMTNANVKDEVLELGAPDPDDFKMDPDFEVHDVRIFITAFLCISLYLIALP